MSCVSKLPYPPDDALRAPAAVRRIAIRTTCQQANTSRRQQTAVPARSRCYPPYRNSHALPTNSTHRAVSKTARRRTQQATLSTRPPNRNPRVLPTTQPIAPSANCRKPAHSHRRPPVSQFARFASKPTRRSVRKPACSASNPTHRADRKLPQARALPLLSAAIASRAFYRQTQHIVPSVNCRKPRRQLRPPTARHTAPLSAVRICRRALRLRRCGMRCLCLRRCTRR